MTFKPDNATLGIIGASPLGLLGSHVAGQLRDLVRSVGALESAAPGTYHAGHAACHAFMNGVQRVVFQGVSPSPSPDELSRALEGALMAGVDAVIAPGQTAPDATDTLVETFNAWCTQRSVDIQSSPLSLWLDAPDRTPVAELLTRAASISSDQIHLCAPWVPTISPGRRASERLPASCLIAPLYLGCATQLKGFHELEGAPGEADRDALARAGCGVLIPHGRRRLVQMASPRPWGDRSGPGRHRSVEAAVEEALNEACTDLLDGTREGEALWQWLTWRCHDALGRFQNQGLITGYRIKCDAELNAHRGGMSLVLVWIRLPRRVDEIQISVLPQRLA